MSLIALFGTDAATLEQAALERLRLLSDGLVRSIGITRVLAEAGREVDLAGFTDAVGLLCARALDLSPETGQHAWPLLDAVLHALDHAHAALDPPTSGRAVAAS